MQPELNVCQHVAGMWLVAMAMGVQHGHGSKSQEVAGLNLFCVDKQ